MRDLPQIIERLRTIEIPEKFDMVIAIANGGIVPAALLNQRLGCEFQVLKLNLRDAMHNKLYDQPRLVEEIKFSFKGKSILLVDDRVKTGVTFAFAKELLVGAHVLKTLAVNGLSDYSLFDEACFRFPWTI